MRLDIINGLRGWAVIGVLLWHVPLVGTYANGLGLTTPIDVAGMPVQLMAPLLQTWQSVNLFFFLSGFVLFLPYVNGQRTMTSWDDLGGFYKTRAKRLLPLYVLVVLVTTLFAYMHHGENWQGFYYNLFIMLTFGYHFVPGEQFYAPLSTPMWSLAPEVYFSILFPLLVVAIRRLGFWPTMIAGCALALATRIAAIAVWPVSETNQYVHPWADSILGRLDDFLFGMVAAHLYHHKWFAKSESKALLLTLLGIVIWSAGAYGWSIYGLWTVQGQQVLPPLTKPFLNYAFNVGPIFLVLGLAHSGRTIRWIWSVWPIQLLGMMCYSIYLWHWPVMFLSTHRGGTHHLDPHSVLVFLGYTLAIASITYRYVEFGHVRDGWLLFKPLPPLPSPGAGKDTVDLPHQAQPTVPLPAAGTTGAMPPRLESAVPPAPAGTTPRPPA